MVGFLLAAAFLLFLQGCGGVLVISVYTCQIWETLILNHCSCLD